MRIVTGLVFLLSVVCSGAAYAQAVAVIPFKLIDNRIIVPITIEGQGPFQCIIDSGASSLISTEVAAQLGKSVALSEGPSGGVGENRVRSGSTTLKTVQVARGIEVHDVPTTAMPFDDTIPVFGKVKIDAVFGTPLFEQFTVIVDYDKRELSFQPKTMAIASGNAVVIPIERSGIPIVSSKLDGVPARFGLDLGARSSLLLYTPFIEKNGLREKYHAGFSTITGWGIGGPVRSQIARAKTLELGGVSVNDIVIRLSTQKTGGTTYSRFDGLIGPDVLKQFRVTFDYAHNRVLLERSSLFGKRDSYDRLGAWFIQKDDAFSVLEVVPDGPAAKAGLRKDDIVLAIDGHPTSSLLLPEARTRLRTLPSGSSVRFQIKRGTETLELRAVLRDLV